jgi:hypothetical protein
MTRRRAAALAAIWILPSLAFLSLVHCVQSAYRIDVPPRFSDDARSAIAARLRVALEGGTAPMLEGDELRRRLPARGPVIVQVWVDGTMRGRVDGYGDTVAEAVESAAGLIPEHATLRLLDEPARARARLKVDAVVGRGDLEMRFPLLDLVTMHPGIDGIGVAVDGVEHLILPDELIMLGALTKKRPFPTMPDFALGLDMDKLDEVFARRNGLTGKWKAIKADWLAKSRRYFRLRTDAFVERRPEHRGDGAPHALVRGIPDGPEPTREVLREAALEGARYLIAHLQPNGRYIYEVDMSTGAAKSGYSIPRHAGTTYFLAEIYRITKEEFLREPIERAFAHLKELIDLGGCKGTLPDGEAFACVLDKGQKVAEMGSTALGVVALAEYQRATGEKTYEPMAREMAAWILMMQKPDGSYMHRYDVRTHEPDRKSQLLYYTGEAALAMARMHEITGEERYAVSARRALDWLVDWYDFFAGGFVYFEEHWTCIASEAAFPAAKRDKYREFCDGYAAFLRAQQPEVGDFPSQPDLAGAYTVTPFVMPYNTPAGSRTEAVISAYVLGLHHGKPNPEILKQIKAALKYTLRQQIRPESDYNVAAKANGLGGVPGSPIDRSVRIDYVQHVCSAMIRASELVE